MLVERYSVSFFLRLGRKDVFSNHNIKVETKSLHWILLLDLQGFQITNTRLMTALRGGLNSQSHTPSIFPHSFCIPRATTGHATVTTTKPGSVTQVPACNLFPFPWLTLPISGLGLSAPQPTANISPSHPAGQMPVHEGAWFSHGIHSTGTLAKNHVLLNHQLSIIKEPTSFNQSQAVLYPPS